MTTLFSIQIDSNAGVGDKLHRFLILYRLGRALGYSYVHTSSIESKRSIRSSEKTAGFWRKIIRRAPEPSLAEFLGLDLHEEMVASAKYANYTPQIVDVLAIFAERGIGQPTELKRRIEVAAPQPIYVLRWTGKWHLQSIRRLNRFLDRWCEMDSKQAAVNWLEFPQKYLLAREKWPQTVPFDAGKVRLCIHLRKGDRAVIRLNNKFISVFASEATLVDNMRRFQADARSEKHRSLVEVGDVVRCLRRIHSHFGAETFSTIVVSDGYERTFWVIRRALQNGQLVLQPDELRQLKRLEISAPREFDGFQSLPNTTAIVGESRQKFYQSVHAIVSADIVIRTVGGFASLNRWFHPQEQFSLTVNFELGCDRVIKRIDSALAALESQGRL